jgi:hypothetical protein
MQLLDVRKEMAALSVFCKEDAYQKVTKGAQVGAVFLGPNDEILFHVLATLPMYTHHQSDNLSFHNEQFGYEQLNIYRKNLDCS